MSLDDRLPQDDAFGQSPNLTGAHVKGNTQSVPAVPDFQTGNGGEDIAFSQIQDPLFSQNAPAMPVQNTAPVAPSATATRLAAAIPGQDLPTDLPGVQASKAQDPSFTAQMRAVRMAEGAPSNAKPAVFFDNVTKIYDAQPDKPALQNVSLRIYSGEFVFLVGHSGSGKSTFIRLINREIAPTAGSLYIAGENLTEMKSWRIPFLRRNIGCVFQDFKLLPKKTTFENVAFALEVIGKSKHIIRTQVPEVLRLVGLEEKMDKYPDQLSGGEQQRVSIARAIVNRPPLLICDEPTGNLDPQTSLGIMRLLDRINRTGTIVLVATHDREMVNSMRRRVITLDNGHVVRDQDRGVYGLDA